MIKLKPLEWSEMYEDENTSYHTWETLESSLKFKMQKQFSRGKEIFILESNENSWIDCLDTLEEAKAKADLYYENFILSHLEEE